MSTKRRWKPFALGLGLGLLLGGTASAGAAVVLRPTMSGTNGYLMRWDVVNSDGDTVCSDPYVWMSTREIECD